MVVLDGEAGLFDGTASCEPGIGKTAAEVSGTTNACASVPVFTAVEATDGGDAAKDTAAEDEAAEEAIAEAAAATAAADDTATAAAVFARLASLF